MRKVMRYEVRYWPSDSGYSRTVGRGKVLPGRKALKVVKRLKRRGVDAFITPVMVRVT